MVSVGFYIEHGFFGLCFFALFALFYINWQRFRRVAQPRLLTKGLNYLAATLFIVYIIIFIDYRAAYGFLPPQLIYFVYGYIEALLFAVLCFYLYVILRDIYLNEEFDVSPGLNADTDTLVKRAQYLFVGVVVFMFVGATARGIVVLAMYSQHKDQLSIVDGCWQYWLALTFLVLLIVFIVLSIQLR